MLKSARTAISVGAAVGLVLVVGCSDGESEGNSSVVHGGMGATADIAGSGGNGGAGGNGDRSTSNTSSTSSTSGGSTGGTGGGADVPNNVYCESWMDCIGGNQLDVVACISNAKYLVDLAIVQGCVSEHNAAFQCSAHKSMCVNEYYAPPPETCSAENMAHLQCVVGATAPASMPPSSTTAIAACADQAVCEQVTDLKRYICELMFDQGGKVAEIYGCAAEHEAYADCVINHAVCDADVWDDSACEAAFNARNECVSGASRVLEAP